MKRLTYIRIVAALIIIVILVTLAFTRFDPEQDSNTYKESVIITSFKANWINRGIFVVFSSRDSDYVCVDNKGAITDKQYSQLNYKEQMAFYCNMFQKLIDEQKPVQLTITPEKSVVSLNEAHVVQIEEGDQVLFSIAGHNRAQQWDKVGVLVLAALIAVGLAAYCVLYWFLNNSSSKKKRKKSRR